MNDPGLTTRLRQHSRRAGLVVGLSMLLTIAICVGVPVVIYAQLNPFATDFVPADLDGDPLPTRTPRPEREAAEGDADEEAEPEATRPPEEPEPTEPPPPTPTPEGFVATHVVDSSTAVNFRSEPDRTQNNVLRVLDIGTTLRFLGDQQVEEAFGENWLRCALEDGTEGWVLEGATSVIEEAQ
jgi:Bacterial SH3 domain